MTELNNVSSTNGYVVGHLTSKPQATLEQRTQQVTLERSEAKIDLEEKMASADHAFTMMMEIRGHIEAAYRKLKPNSSYEE